jgi:hypothetical protein
MLVRGRKPSPLAMTLPATDELAAELNGVDGSGLICTVWSPGAGVTIVA